MPTFTANPNRFNPYSNFKYHIVWDNKVVAGVSKVSPLKRTTEVIEHRPGGDASGPKKQPGQSSYEGITLERGVTHDLEFVRWTNKVWNYREAIGKESSLADFRKNITLNLLNEAGQVVLAWQIFECWVSEYQAIGELDANGNAVAIEMLKLENEGFKLDAAVKEPSEPTFVEPAG